MIEREPIDPFAIGDCIDGDELEALLDEQPQMSRAGQAMAGSEDAASVGVVRPDCLPSDTLPAKVIDCAVDVAANCSTLARTLIGLVINR